MPRAEFDINNDGELLLTSDGNTTVLNTVTDDTIILAKSSISRPDPFTAAITKMLREYGHYIVHIRKTTKLCPKCTDGKSGSGSEVNPRCPICLGLNYVVKSAPALVRITAPIRPNFNGLGEYPIGIFGSSDNIYYMLSTASPSQGDLLVEVTWDVPREQVLHRGNVLAVHKVNEANSVLPMRGERGEVAYFKLAVHDIDIEVPWITSVLKTRR